MIVSPIVGLILFASASWIVGGHLVAPSHRNIGPPPDDLPIQTAELASQSGAQIATWYLHAPNATTTVVLVHGIRGDRRSMLGRGRMLYESGFSVVILDLQAHGESRGDRITLGWLERKDVAAAVDFARAQNPTHKIAVVGRSLGGAATLLADDLHVDGVVLESVYPTIERAVQNRLAMRASLFTPLLKPALLCQLQPRLGIRPDDLRPIDHIAAKKCPVLILCGNEDQHTTLEESRMLFAAAAEPKELVVFDGARHVDLHAHDSAKYESTVLPFLHSL